MKKEQVLIKLFNIYNRKLKEEHKKEISEIVLVDKGYFKPGEYFNYYESANNELGYKEKHEIIKVYINHKIKIAFVIVTDTMTQKNILYYNYIKEET